MKNKRPPIQKGTALRLIKTVFGFYPKMAVITVALIIFNSIISSIPSVFMQKVIAIVEDAFETGKTWQAVSGAILGIVAILVTLYALSLAANLIYHQLMAVITQGVLAKMREKMFNGMQNLPIEYFDTHTHGDIMSYYTNDIDTLRQMISQSFPNLLNSAIIVITVISIMLYYSLWLTLIVVIGVLFMTVITKKIAGGSAKYFLRQQREIAKTEGFIEEMMNGQKVVKVFNHEQEAKLDFDKVNDKLCEESTKAHTYANVLMPILHNIGNILYVLVAVFGGILLILKAPNIGFSMLPLSISIVVPFLNMTKQFSGNVSQVSQQINSVVTGLAGAQRIFELVDKKPESDDGFITLVNVKENADGSLTETTNRTGTWAWKQPDYKGGFIYTKLSGDVRFKNVVFGYTKDKIILHDISLYAKPGQRVAFVGSTGAGKTTITNLINRFYDISEGEITYDGIDIKKIKKADLRRSLGMVLQETNLFTGTVLENIRYGRLEATDEECFNAAKIVGADDFITRLPKGYDTEIVSNGANLSQGQRQLISIARAAVADPPVMILDEATSSIDTRTEAIVQKGMDALMNGKTVFVIAHRLSTVKNSDAIMVLEHGEIIERGTHEELLAKKGTFYKLYTGSFELE